MRLRNPILPSPLYRYDLPESARGKCFFAIDIALDGIRLSTEAIRAIFPRLRDFIILVIYEIGKSGRYRR